MRIPHPPVPDATVLPPPRPPIADVMLRVVTPMFGGGVEPGVVDENERIRPAAIRGHLRFWWRACNAARYPDLPTLKAAEARLWGSATNTANAASGHGAIGIQLDPDPDNPGEIAQRQNGPPFVMFPFIDKNNTG